MIKRESRPFRQQLPYKGMMSPIVWLGSCLQRPPGRNEKFGVAAARSRKYKDGYNIDAGMPRVSAPRHLRKTRTSDTIAISAFEPSNT